MGEKAFRTTLFVVFLTVYFATAVITIGSLPNNGIPVDPVYKKWLFSILIVETVSAVVALFAGTMKAIFADPPNVAGEWMYECVRDNGEYKHGGVATIFVKAGPLGWEFSIQGKRTWFSVREDSEWKRTVLDAPAVWQNSWGTFTGSDHLRYAYSVKTAKAHVEGYGWATLKAGDDKKVLVMEGGFYQLPPHDPFYGFQVYTRCPESATKEHAATKEEPSRTDDHKVVAAGAN